MDSTVRDRSETGDAAGAVWTVTVIHHPHPDHVGVRVAVPAGDAIELGRGGDALGPRGLDDVRLSRRHARIAADGDDRLRVSDLGSTNGIWVNSQRALEQRLEPGDVIGAGSLLLLIGRGPARFSAPAHPLVLGRSPAIAALIDAIERVAPRATTVLITGETGAGKDRVARALHAASGRAGALVPIDCGAVPDRLLHEELFGRGATGGLLARAAGGTLLLDSIGDASPALQAALLRFLDDGVVRPPGGEPVALDVRVIATRRDGDGSALRDDFLARLQRFTVRVPPLRERRDDIPLLAAHFARALAGGEVELARGLVAALVRYGWPRNVRELESVIERAWIERTGPSLELTPAVAEVIGEPSAAPAAAWPPDAFVLAGDGSWFRPPRSPRVALAHRPTLAALVRALVTGHQAAPGRPIALDALIAAGWPEQRLVDDSGTNRAYVAIATLRKLGLRDVIDRDDAGYRLSPSVPFVIA